MVKTIKVWQLKENESNHGLFFSSLDFLEKFGLNVSLSNYDVVYTETSDVKEMDAEDFLEDLYVKFQGAKPNGYCGHSLSVSDIISIDNEYYYCDSFGFEKLNF